MDSVYRQCLLISVSPKIYLTEFESARKFYKSFLSCIAILLGYWEQHIYFRAKYFHATSQIFQAFIKISLQLRGFVIGCLYRTDLFGNAANQTLID